MPYPRQIERDDLIQRAWELVEAGGIDQLSLSRLAGEFGVKAPSLYKHVKNKAAIIQAVNALTSIRLLETLVEAAEAVEAPAEKVRAVAWAYRRFGLAHPTTYALTFTTHNPDARLDAEAAVEGVLPLQAIMAQIVGEAESLSATRGLMALAHGFVMLETHNQWQRGGSFDDAFNLLLEAFLRGLAGA